MIVTAAEEEEAAAAVEGIRGEALLDNGAGEEADEEDCRTDSVTDDDV